MSEKKRKTYEMTVEVVDEIDNWLCDMIWSGGISPINGGDFPSSGGWLFGKSCVVG